MGVSYDCASSVLLCSEDNISILGFDAVDDDDDEGADGRIPEQKRVFYGDFPMGFPLQSEECLELLVERESEHFPGGEYAKRLMGGELDLSVRRDAIDWISKVHAHYSFGPLSAYLSVNYLDRFLSVYKLPQGKAWMTQLLSVACLSLAAKMEETTVPLSLDLQVADAKYVFEARTIQRMELLVLSTLKWRMQAVTPFTFIDHFLHKFNAGDSPTKQLISCSAELILSTIRGIGFLEFRPSEIAAAVALSALGEAQVVEFDKAVTSSILVNKERVMRCYEVIQDLALMNTWPLKRGSPPVSSVVVPQSPNGVLDACLSCRSDDTAVGSHASSHHTSPVSNKRRRLNRS